MTKSALFHNISTQVTRIKIELRESTSSFCKYLSAIKDKQMKYVPSIFWQHSQLVIRVVSCSFCLFPDTKLEIVYK